MALKPGTLTPAASTCWRFGPFEVDERLRELRRDGVPLAIEPKPLSMLLLLLRQPSSLITRSELIDTLWTGRVVSDSVLANCVAKLRQVLGDQDQTLVRTVHGYGYRFDAQPQRLDSGAPVLPPRLDLAPGQVPPLRPDWRLVRRLGKSGETWLGENTRTGQFRAFKFAAGAEALSRLKREVTLYRLLQTDFGSALAVVPIYDWNFDEPPFFTESACISGGSLEEWVESRSGAAQIPLAERLSVVEQIATTIAAVHQVGVLHKDLKPANVLIEPEDGAVTVRVGDFGSGLVTDLERLDEAIGRAGFTQVLNEDASGTPLYVAPEVLAGQPATVRSDIYALGVILFQLLAGDLRRPLAPGWEREIDDELLREDIALAADGNPARRLADAGDLAERLRTLETRRAARAQARRDEAAAAAAARDLERMRARRARQRLVVAALSVGLTLCGGLYWQARQARIEAEHLVRRTQALSEFLTQDVLAQLGNREWDSRVKDVRVKDLLEVALTSAGQRFADDPELEAESFESIGRSFLAIDEMGGAQRAFDQSLALRERTVGADTLRLVAQLIMLSFHNGDLQQRLPHFEDLTAHGAMELGPDHPAVAKAQLALASGYNVLGQWQRSADEIKRLRAGPAAERDPWFAGMLVHYLANVDNELARFGEAEALLRNRLGELEKLPMTSSIAEGVMTANLRLGRTYIDTARLAEAEVSLSEALALIEQWDTPASPGMLLYRDSLARLRLEQQRPAEAARLMEQQIHDFGGLKVGFGDQILIDRRLLAEAYQQLGRLEEAEQVIRLTLDGQRHWLPVDHPRTREARILLADVLRQRGRTAEAWKVLNDAPALVMDDLPPDHPFVAALHRVRGLLALADGSPDLAQTELAEALRQTRLYRPADSWRVRRLQAELDRAGAPAATAP